MASSRAERARNIEIFPAKVTDPSLCEDRVLSNAGDVPAGINVFSEEIDPAQPVSQAAENDSCC